jgi:uncharacterized protein (DUF427 family)
VPDAAHPRESVWDYPRPPRLEPVRWRLTVEHRGVVVADTTSGWRVLETSQPPAYYLPAADVRTDLLRPSTTVTACEWKGLASYADLVLPDGTTVEQSAWHYPRPRPDFAAIAGCWAFYPQRVDRCTVDGEVVAPNPGSFYGGWITSWVEGPFKGGPGTAHW